jgi:uncharacterized membrane protein
VRGHRDLKLVLAATAICMVGSLITPLGAARAVFVVPLTLVLPGYAIAAAAFGPRRPKWPEMVPLTVGLSLVALVLGSLLLNYTPGGIRGLPWALLLALVVLGCCRGAAIRRRREPRRSPLRLPKVSWGAALLLVGAAALATVALILAQTTFHADRALGFTELWMVPPGHSGRQVEIGVTSESQHTTNYRLQIRYGDPARSLDRSLTLDPGKSRTFRLAPPASSRPTAIEATLFRAGHPGTVYREVHGWLPAAGETSRPATSR